MDFALVILDATHATTIDTEGGTLNRLYGNLHPAQTHEPNYVTRRNRGNDWTVETNCQVLGNSGKLHL
ncbi:MAG: hypothetical protein CMB16_03105 [Euryarchaeota archaeon]|nr:hypothetical protein [Euryarchaeota archaeon]